MNQMLLIANALAALGITLRLLTYQRHESTHQWPMAFVAYGLIVSCGITVIRTVSGQYTGPVDPSEVVLKFALLMVIWRVRGNVRCLSHPDRYDNT